MHVGLSPANTQKKMIVAMLCVTMHLLSVLDAGSGSGVSAFAPVNLHTDIWDRL